MKNTILTLKRDISKTSYYYLCIWKLLVYEEPNFLKKYFCEISLRVIFLRYLQ